MDEKNPAEILKETVPQKAGENRSEKALSKVEGGKLEVEIKIVE